MDGGSKSARVVGYIVSMDHVPPEVGDGRTRAVHLPQRTTKRTQITRALFASLKVCWGARDIPEPTIKKVDRW